jgi:hypothetical protein
MLNNPFTFQSMEKHSAYCAMIRLGLPIPDTWLIPAKQSAPTPTSSAARPAATTTGSICPASQADQLPALHEALRRRRLARGQPRGQPAWELMTAYDASGQTMMHLQQGLENFDIFVRALAIGPQVNIFHYDPTRPMHDRYQVDSGFLSDQHAAEATAVVKTINAFFRWEFNSCESILKNGVLQPIDFANACPDVAIVSLHYYFPWAIKSLLAWSLFCLATDRRMRLDMNTRSYFDIADSERSYPEKLAAYEALADAYFDTERFAEFRATQLNHLDAVTWELAQAQEFDDMLVHNVRLTSHPTSMSSSSPTSAA